MATIYRYASSVLGCQLQYFSHQLHRGRLRERNGNRLSKNCIIDDTEIALSRISRGLLFRLRVVSEVGAKCIYAIIKSMSAWFVSPQSFPHDGNGKL